MNNPKLPDKIREAAETAGHECLRKHSEGKPYCKDFWMEACEWLYAHLLKAGTEFDEDYCFNVYEGERGCTDWEAYCRGARWQQAQDAAQIAALKAAADQYRKWSDQSLQTAHAREEEIERLKDENLSLKSQIDDISKERVAMKAELAEAKAIISGKTFSYPPEYEQMRTMCERLAGAIQEFEDACVLKSNLDAVSAEWRERWENARGGLTQALTEWRAYKGEK